MRNLFKLSTVVVLMVMFPFTGCQMENADEKDQQPFIYRSINKKEVEKEVSSIIYPLPTAYEVTELLKEIGASYILSISNPVKKAEMYFTTKSKAINLGIYSADLCYASTYNQKQKTYDYINASYFLIEELDFSEAVDNNLPQKIEQAGNQKKEMIELITHTFHHTYKYLNQTGRASVSLLVLAGSWLEALYIATHISDDTYHNKKMIEIIMLQKQSLNKLFELMYVHNSNIYIAQTMKELNILHHLFNQLNQGSITSEQYQAIADEVAKVREMMVH